MYLYLPLYLAMMYVYASGRRHDTYANLSRMSVTMNSNKNAKTRTQTHAQTFYITHPQGEETRSNTRTKKNLPEYAEAAILNLLLSCSSLSRTLHRSASSLPDGLFLRAGASRDECGCAGRLCTDDFMRTSHEVLRCIDTAGDALGAFALCWISVVSARVVCARGFASSWVTLVFD